MIKVFPLLGTPNDANIRYAIKKSAFTLKRFSSRTTEIDDSEVFHVEIEVNENLTSTQKTKVKDALPGSWIEFT